jgi:IS5 family transposase
VQRVLEQTRARVFKGDSHHPGKVLSLFESPSEAIRKGKLSKPTESGKLVKIQEAEGQLVTDNEAVCYPRPRGDAVEALAAASSAIPSRDEPDR